MAEPDRKPPNIWALASWTYGIVILVTILAVIAYYYVVPKRTGPAPADVRTVAVGSVWLPVYPGAVVENQTYTKQDAVTESILTFTTKDPASPVLMFYQAALQKGVFRFATLKRSPIGGTVQSLAHKGNTKVLVTIQTNADGTHGEIRTTDTDSKN